MQVSWEHFSAEMRAKMGQHCGAELAGPAPPDVTIMQHVTNPPTANGKHSTVVSS